MTYLGVPEVCNPEHELQDAVPARDDGRVGDADGSASVLGVGDACKDDAQGDRVQEEAHDGLAGDEEGGQVAVVGAGVAVTCATSVTGNGRFVCPFVQILYIKKCETVGLGHSNPLPWIQDKKGNQIAVFQIGIPISHIYRVAYCIFGASYSHF